MKEYKIIQKYTIEELEKEVNDLVKTSGWELAGGLVIYDSVGIKLFCQSIYRNIMPSNWAL